MKVKDLLTLRFNVCDLKSVVPASLGGAFLKLGHLRP